MRAEHSRRGTEAATRGQHRRRRRPGPQRRAARGHADRAQPRLRGLRHPEGLPRPARHQVPRAPHLRLRPRHHPPRRVHPRHQQPRQPAGHPRGGGRRRSGTSTSPTRRSTNFRRPRLRRPHRHRRRRLAEDRRRPGQEGHPDHRRAQDDRQRPRRHLRDLRLRDRGGHRHRRHRQAALDGGEPRPRDGGRGDGPLLRLDRAVRRHRRLRRRDPDPRDPVRHREGLREGDGSASWTGRHFSMVVCAEGARAARTAS